MRIRVQQVRAEAGEAREAARLAQLESREQERRNEERRRQQIAEKLTRLRQEREKQARLQQKERERRERELAQRQQAADQEVERFLKENGATAGDLRMCRNCRAGPVENQACRDLGLHNNESGGNLNRCRNCGWFSAEWHDWLPWDGVMYPH